MHTEQELQSWSNPVLKIKDPLKRRWAEIKQTMDTHINGVCPIHLYYARRPLESNNTYALAYRVNNFQPVTKEAFDRTLNSINDLIKNANIKLNAPDFILNSTYKIKDVELYNFCISSLTKIRETDSNAVIVVMPLVDIVDEFNVRIKDVDVVYVESHHIEKIDNNYIRFKAGEVEFGEIEHKYYIIVDNGQYLYLYHA